MICVTDRIVVQDFLCEHPFLKMNPVVSILLLRSYVMSFSSRLFDGDALR